MMDYFYTSPSIFPIFSSLNGTDTLTLTAGSALIAPSFTVREGEGQGGASLSIEGQLRVQSVALNGSSSVTVLSAGSIIGTGASGAVIVGLDVGGSIVNDGLISNANGYAVVSRGTGGSVNNSGTISGSNGVWLGPDTVSNQSLANSGEILALNTAVTISTRDASLLNTGVIQNSGGFGFAIALDGSDASQLPFRQTIINHGSIQGMGGAITADGNTFRVLLLANSGDITSITGSAIAGSAGIDRITNTGTISGDIFCNTGNDVVRNHGAIAGDVYLGAGTDTFDGRGGKIAGFVWAGDGADTYIVDRFVDLREEGATSGDIDTVQADVSWRLGRNFENLTLLGVEDYRGTGNGLNNVIAGNAGDNRLSGLEGDDTLSGDDGDDRILGGIGFDTIAGGSGNDMLIGGAGRDVLTGDSGADVFVFATLSHSNAARANADLITDFALGEDRIDLSGIDAIRSNALSEDAFQFIGAATFSAAGQVRATQNAGFVLVEMDVDGDGVTDSAIRLTGTLTLNASDFVL